MVAGGKLGTVQPPAPAEMAARLRAEPRVALVMEALQGEPSAHLVGGAVRDLLLGRPEFGRDLDVVVEGDAAQAAGRAAQRIGGRAVVHDRFNTASVNANGLSFDVAGARAESYSHPGALPEVRPAGLEEDLRRRDFTVNALAAALEGPAPGTLRAVPGALDDLETGTLRVLHPDSFRDDPTRLLRLVRYGGRLAFAPDERTEQLAREAAQSGALKTVSGERVGAELRLLLREGAAPLGVTLLGRLGIAAALHPGFVPRPDLAGGAAAFLEDGDRADLLLLAACCLDMEADELRGWLDHLGFRGGDRDTVTRAATEARDLAEALGRATRPSEIAEAAAGRPPEAIALAGALGADTPALRWLHELRHVRLDITGEDLLAAGVAEGPDVGRALRAALGRRLDGDASGREEQLRAALEAVGRP
jgi:tRNA nucleotidyltransferase (CCA-adding enzyme)